jgi:hypothetical protein
VTAPPLALAGLTEPEVGQYVDLIGEAVAPEVVPRLRDQTEGNPLFVSEILRLHAMEGGPRASGPERRLAIPKGVRDVIARRLTYLSAECEGIAMLASVLGREFSFDVLARMAEVPADALLDALDEAIGVRVLAEVSGATDRLRFAHVLIGETLYEGLTAARRLHLHRRAAAALEALHGDRPGPHLAELAHHAVAGRDPDRGLRFARAAGDRALELLAYEEAARLYRLADQALALRAPAPPVERCELLIAIGDALARAGSTEDAKATFLAACDVASTAFLPESFARAALGYGGRSSWQRAGEDHRLVPLLEEALAGLGPTPTALRARLLARVAGALRDQPSLEPRVSRAREAVAIARRLGDDDTLAYALVALFMAMWGPDIEQLTPIADEVSAIAAKTGVDGTMLDALTMKSILAWTALADADPATLDDEYAALAAERRQPAQQWQGAMVSVVLALFRGDLADAERLAAAALESGQARHSDADCSYRLTMFVLRREQGRLEEVRDLVRDAVDRYPGYRSFPCFAALLACELGPDEAARRAFDDLARRGFVALPRDGEWLFCLSLLSEVAVRLRDRERADELYRLLLPYARLNATASGEVAIGSVARGAPPGRARAGEARGAGGRRPLRGRHHDEHPHGRAAVAGAQPRRLRTHAPSPWRARRRGARPRASSRGRRDLPRARHGRLAFPRPIAHVTPRRRRDHPAPVLAQRSIGTRAPAAVASNVGPRSAAAHHWAMSSGRCRSPGCPPTPAPGKRRSRLHDQGRDPHVARCRIRLRLSRKSRLCPAGVRRSSHAAELHRV